MSTKRFSMPVRPTPTSDEMARADAFVSAANSGEGAAVMPQEIIPKPAPTVNAAPKAVAIPETFAPEVAPVVKTARLTIDLPKDLHRRFKRACLDHETKMVTEVLKFIEEWTQKHS